MTGTFCKVEHHTGTSGDSIGGALG